MKYLLDIVLLCVLAIFVAIDASRGFIKSVWNFVSAFAALGASFLFGGWFGNILYNTVISDLFSTATLEAIRPLIYSDHSGYDLSKLFSEMPAEFTDIIQRYGADIEELTSYYTGYAGAASASEESLVELSRTISYPVANTVSSAIGYLGVFIAALIFMQLIGLLFNLIAKLPIIKSANILLGAVFGVFSGFIYLWVICIIIAVIIETGIWGDFGQLLSDIAESSYIFKFLYVFSPFDFINIKAMLLESALKL